MDGRYKEVLLRVLRWAPRVIGILYTLFLASFALDTLTSGYNGLDSLAALIIHLAPAIIVGVAVDIAWKRQLHGGVFFIILGIIGFFFFSNPFVVNLLAVGPAFLSGILFIADYCVKKICKKEKKKVKRKK